MLLTALTAAAVFGLDALSKLWAANALAAGPRTVIGGLLELRLTQNDGIALGMLGGNGPAILLLPLAVILCGWFLLRRYLPTPFVRAAVGLILGGFLGNFRERLFQGYVLDMLYFPFLPWFICNLADVAICAGVLLLVISLLFRPEDWRERHATNDRDGEP